MQLSSDPAAVFGRFLDRQQRSEQFTEDMKKVVHTGPGLGSSSSCGPRMRTPGSAASRTRSPGLAAGAALALSGASTAAGVHADAHDQRRHTLENARRIQCPFDDHSAFGAKVGELGSRPPQMPAHAARDARVAVETSKAMGRQNRDVNQKVGMGTPWDAPEHGPIGSSSIAASCITIQPQALAEAHTEMVRNKQRMQGTRDLISGDYLQGPGTAMRRDGSLPPRPSAELMPEAQMKFQLKGGSHSTLTHGKAAYLNSAVLADNIRLRNETVFHLA
mmetsp:Transcript_17702/g.48152  ORF Transcript_17702/g.48152 Transcript_17702/m.48152 type:complete len:276 (-) Transcript_17702:36-863(-)